MSVTYTSISSLLASPFQRLTSSMWNTATLLLYQLYETGGNSLTSILQNGNLYIPNNISALAGFFQKEVYVSGQPVLTEQDPIYIAGFIGTANQQINQILYSNQQLYYSISQLPKEISYDLYTNLYRTISDLTSTLSSQISQLQKTGINALYSIADFLAYTFTYFYLATVGLANTLNKLTLFLSPPTIEGLQISLSTIPSPIYNGSTIETVRIILQNLSNYIVYIGNKLYNSFPILPGDSLEFHVRNPSNVYAWATGKCTVYALFEVVQ
ncbi:hypothetical protein SIRV1gp34 [Sulfolobus islandicus rod-shaped virus 1]|uniref:Uncharacterized protein 268 n=1 Tax=Sulfolobus islandicus rod-shaped virus 1 TaxID=157898 RepID=Y268_SIRV1|nr:hypothetical protein SIRV1gp34 [Sulfolobus islandicus rod-shaped virus 1]Q8QL22.1 RecName: Full=Uncharacterized protein 268 [Sulfolobus islandicus rod-shaped virus 1]CAC93989.1 hypothetical protein [Sulfolobus islandicus rod-shaped virus 1]CAG38853.1 hypothetical protein [Sulfolobus islandicus rudivirus 1 variant XX]